MSAWKFFLAFGIVAAIVIGATAHSQWRAQETDAENAYHGFAFAQSAEGLWVTEIQVGKQPYVIPFYNHPRDTETVIFHEDVRDLLLGEKPERIIISVDPDAGSRVVIAGVEISRITGHKYNLINVPTSSAFSREAPAAVDVPIATCANARNGTVVIQFVQDPEANAIVRDGDCLILFYKTPEESIRVADRLAYALLRIM